MKIKVGWLDILLGEQGSPNFCMTARALKRAFPQAELVSVSGVGAEVWQGEQVTRYVLPEEVTRQIRMWDHWKLWSRPFAFELGAGETRSFPVELAEEAELVFAAAA